MIDDNSHLTTNIEIVQILRDSLKASTTGITNELNQYAYLDTNSEVDWMSNFLGFARGLEVAGLIASGTTEKLQKYSPQKFARRKQMRACVETFDFSADIFTRTPSDEIRKFQLDVRALNPIDAYAKISQRSTYQMLGSIELVLIFKGLKQYRCERQEAIKAFTKTQLISPK
jgi:hypothetical protein